MVPPTKKSSLCTNPAPAGMAEALMKTYENWDLPSAKWGLPPFAQVYGAHHPLLVRPSRASATAATQPGRSNTALEALGKPQAQLRQSQSGFFNIVLYFEIG